MDQLQILDLQGNSLSRIPLSVGFLKSLNTLLLAGNPFDLNLDTLLSPILQSQDDDEEVIGNSPAALIKNRRIRMKLKPPGYPYLQRLQGYLRDVYELRTAVPSKKSSNGVDIGPDFLVSCCRISLTSSVETTEYRQKLIGELLSTEETYSEQLGLIIKFYMMPIAAIVESKFSELLFSNIQEISELHSDLILPSMKQLINTYNQPIGALFSTVCPYLKIYADYMEHFNISNTLVTYLGNPTCSKAKLDVFMSAYIPDNETIMALSSIFKKQSNSVPQLINLQASLLLPVQRLPRYQLLLKSLLKYTPKSHPDFLNIQNGLRDISHLIEYCNERKGNSERMLKTLLPLGKIQQPSNLAKFSLVPTPNRGLVSEYHSIKVLKWVQLNNSEIYFQPLKLCKGKNAHFLKQAKGLLCELKFKPINDLNPQKHARIIENSGKCAKFDCCDLIGKRCTLYLCDDVLLVCSTTFQFVGALPITKSTAVEFLNITSNNIPTDFSIIRLSHPSGILYLKGLNPDINQMESLVQSLIRK